MPTPSLETTTTKLFARRNPGSAGIHLAVFAAYSTSTGYLAYETQHDKSFQDLFPAAFMGYIIGGIALIMAVEYIARRYVTPQTKV